MNGILVDTNLLVYAADPAEARKRERAIAVLSAIGFAGRGRLSAQCLSEYCNVVLRRKLLSAAEADQVVAHYAGSWGVFDVTPGVVREALRGVWEHRMNFWDAQIWAVARLHGIETVLSEDFQDGLRVEGVRFVDPFKTSFDLEALN